MAQIKNLPLVWKVFDCFPSVLMVYYHIRLKAGRAFGCIEQHLGLNNHIVRLN
jgi:hypothetical protein